jgi:hypothetical protein
VGPRSLLRSSARYRTRVRRKRCQHRSRSRHGWTDRSISPGRQKLGRCVRIFFFYSSLLSISIRRQRRKADSDRARASSLLPWVSSSGFAPDVYLNSIGAKLTVSGMLASGIMTTSKQCVPYPQRSFHSLKADGNTVLSLPLCFPSYFASPALACLAAATWRTNRSSGGRPTAPPTPTSPLASNRSTRLLTTRPFMSSTCLASPRPFERFALAFMFPLLFAPDYLLTWVAILSCMV